MVAPVPSVGRLDLGVQGTPSEIIEQPAMAAIPLPMTERTRLPTALVAPIVVGMAQPVATPPMHVEVAAAVIGGSQLGAIVATPKAPV